MGTRTKKAATKKKATKKAARVKPASKKATAKKTVAKKSAAKKPVATTAPVKKATKPARRKPSLGLEVDPAVLEFIAAIERFKKSHTRPFPSWSEVLHVLRGLGYRKP